MTADDLTADIRDRLQAEPALFELLESGSGDGLWFIDFASRDSWVSPRWKAVFGYRPDEIDDPRTWFEQHLHPEDRLLLEETLVSHVGDASRPYDQVVRVRHRDGSTVWIRRRGVALRDDTGVASGIIGTHTDVSAYKEAEESLHDANDRLRSFAGALAHDLRAPIVSMLSAFHLLEPDRHIPDDFRDEILERIRAAARRADQITQDVLQYSLTSVEHAAVDRLPLDAVMAQVLADVSVLLHDSGVVVACDDLPTVRGDQRGLVQVFRNIVTALVSPGPSDDPTVITISGDDDGTRVRVLLRSEILPTDKPDPTDLFRLTGETDRAAGDDLGLALCRVMLSRDGGTIDVDDSAGGRGFVVTLASAAPATRFRSASSLPSSADPVSGPPLTVLSIDDNIDSRLLVRFQLRDSGIEIAAEVDDPAVAIPTYMSLARRPDVVVLDQRMPTVSGVEVAAQILEIDPEQAIVLYSNHIDDAVRDAAEAAGIRVCVDKGEASLIAAIRLAAANVARDSAR